MSDVDTGRVGEAFECSSKGSTGVDRNHRLTTHTTNAIADKPQPSEAPNQTKRRGLARTRADFDIGADFSARDEELVFGNRLPQAFPNSFSR